MRRDYSHLSPLIWVFLLFSTLSHGQGWSGILAPSRAINWSNAGLPSTLSYGSGGSACNGSNANCTETTANPWTPPVRTQCGSTIAGGTSGSPAGVGAINTALAACKPGTYVLLGPGYFLTSGTGINLHGFAGVSLRGSGPMSTFVEVSSGDQINMGSGASAGYGSLSAAYSAGTTSITITGASGTPTVGMLGILNQCDTGVSGCGYVIANGSTTVTLYTSVNSTPFQSSWAGRTINFNNTNYTVASVNSPTSLTTTTSVPSGYPGYSVGSPTDNNSLFVCGAFDLSTCQSESGSNTQNPPYGHQYQLVLITSVTNNGGGSYTLEISPGLYMPNWTAVTTNGATLDWSTPTVGIGLEDVTIMSPASSNYLNSQSTNVQTNNIYGSWVKGVRFLGTGGNTPIGWNTSKSCLFSNNYLVADLAVVTSNYSGYHSNLNIGESSDMLVLNNVTAIGIPQSYHGGDNGLVTAYNFGRDAFTAYSFDLWSYDHAAHGSFNLYEGNQAGEMDEDNTWGTHDLNTYFRNNISCYDSPYAGGTTNARGLQIGDGQRFENAIGNVIGSPECPAYQSSNTGSVFQIATGDSLVASTLMRWGNVTTAGQSTDTPANSGVRFVSSEVPSSLSGPNTDWENPVPTSDGLPCSFYFSVGGSPCSPLYSGGTGLSWWKVCKSWTTFPTSCAATQTQPFPPAGPELTNGPYVKGYAYDNPAGTAWLNLPIDTTYQRSYTISSSSWSNSSGTCNPAPAPCEILTFASSVLPGITHLQGAFQLSGANSACTSGATINAANELLMTNSSSTTVVYSLPSNPGAACTGTMKFPDVRQFDERVYQNDPAGNLPFPPTSLNAVVQ
jgi:hypothetical protein